MHSKKAAIGHLTRLKKKRTDLRKFADLEFPIGDLPKNRIRDHLRQLIVSGTLLPGERIPTVRDLAALWDKNIATVHFAFTDLLRQGLILRRRGYGTHVAEQIRSLQSAAIYFTPDMIADPLQWFGRSLWIETRNVLLKRGVKPEAWMDQRGDADQVCSELEAAVRERRFQGVILLASGCAPWMKNLSIPLAALTSAPLPFAVMSDLEQLARESVRHLAEAGCRSLGTITSLTAKENSPYYKALSDTAAHYGMEMRKEWIRVPRSSMGLSNFGAFGYEQFRALWSLSKRPQGLIVFPDRMVEGVMLAMSEQGVRAPQDLALVLHRNAGYSFIHPVSATYAVSRESDYAEALVRQLERQIIGESTEQMLIPYRFISAS